MARSLKTFKRVNSNSKPKGVSLGLAFTLPAHFTAAQTETLIESITNKMNEAVPHGTELYAEYKVQEVSDVSAQPTNELIPRVVWMTDSEAEAMESMPENPRTTQPMYNNLASEEGSY